MSTCYLTSVLNATPPHGKGNLTVQFTPRVAMHLHKDQPRATFFIVKTACFTTYHFQSAPNYTKKSGTNLHAPRIIILINEFVKNYTLI